MQKSFLLLDTNVKTDSDPGTTVETMPNYASELQIEDHSVAAGIFVRTPSTVEFSRIMDTELPYSNRFNLDFSPHLVDTPLNTIATYTNLAFMRICNESGKQDVCDANVVGNDLLALTVIPKTGAVFTQLGGAPTALIYEETKEGEVSCTLVNRRHQYDSEDGLRIRQNKNSPTQTFNVDQKFCEMSPFKYQSSSRSTATFNADAYGMSHVPETFICPFVNPVKTRFIILLNHFGVDIEAMKGQSLAELIKNVLQESLKLNPILTPRQLAKILQESIPARQQTNVNIVVVSCVTINIPITANLVYGHSHNPFNLDDLRNRLPVNQFAMSDAYKVHTYLNHFAKLLKQGPNILRVIQLQQKELADLDLSGINSVEAAWKAQSLERFINSVNDEKMDGSVEHYTNLYQKLEQVVIEFAINRNLTRLEDEIFLSTDIPLHNELFEIKYAIAKIQTQENFLYKLICLLRQHIHRDPDHVKQLQIKGDADLFFTRLQELLQRITEQTKAPTFKLYQLLAQHFRIPYFPSLAKTMGNLDPKQSVNDYVLVLPRGCNSEFLQPLIHNLSVLYKTPAKTQDQKSEGNALEELALKLVDLIYEMPKKPGNVLLQNVVNLCEAGSKYFNDDTTKLIFKIILYLADIFKQKFLPRNIDFLLKQLNNIVWVREPVMMAFIRDRTCPNFEDTLKSLLSCVDKDEKLKDIINPMVDQLAKLALKFTDLRDAYSENFLERITACSNQPKLPDDAKQILNKLKEFLKKCSASNKNFENLFRDIHTKIRLLASESYDFYPSISNQINKLIESASTFYYLMLYRGSNRHQDLYNFQQYLDLVYKQLPHQLRLRFDYLEMVLVTLSANIPPTDKTNPVFVATTRYCGIPKGLPLSPSPDNFLWQDLDGNKLDQDPGFTRGRRLPTYSLLLQGERRSQIAGAILNQNNQLYAPNRFNLWHLKGLRNWKLDDIPTIHDLSILSGIQQVQTCVRGCGLMVNKALVVATLTHEGLVISNLGCNNTMAFLYEEYHEKQENKLIDIPRANSGSLNPTTTLFRFDTTPVKKRLLILINNNELKPEKIFALLQNHRSLPLNQLAKVLENTIKTQEARNVIIIAQHAIQAIPISTVMTQSQIKGSAFKIPKDAKAEAGDQALFTAYSTHYYQEQAIQAWQSANNEVRKFINETMLTIKRLAADGMWIKVIIHSKTLEKFLEHLKNKAPTADAKSENSGNAIELYTSIKQNVFEILALQTLIHLQQFKHPFNDELIKYLLDLQKKITDIQAKESFCELLLLIARYLVFTNDNIYKNTFYVFIPKEHEAIFLELLQNLLLKITEQTKLPTQPLMLAFLKFVKPDDGCEDENLDSKLEPTTESTEIATPHLLQKFSNGRLTAAPAANQERTAANAPLTSNSTLRVDR